MSNFTIQSLFPFLSLVFLFFLGVFVFYQNTKATLNRLFLAISVVFSIWLFGTFMMFNNVNNDELVIFWDRFIYLGVSMMPAIEYNFSLIYTKFTKMRERLLIVAYILGLFFLFFSRTDYFVAGVFRYQWGAHTIAHLGHHFFLIFFFFYIFALLYNFYFKYKESENSMEQYRLRYLIIGFAFLNIVGGIGYLPAYKISIFSPISLIAPLIFSILIGYTIIKYRFLNIKIIIRRGSIFTLLVILSTALYTLLSYIITISFQDLTDVNSVLVTGLTTSILVALGFQPLKLFLQLSTDRFLFKGEYNIQDLLAKLGDIMSSSLDLRQLSDYLETTLANSFRTDGVVLELIDKKTGHLRVVNPGGGNKGKIKPLMGQENKSALVDYLNKEHETIVYEEWERKISDGLGNSAMERVMAEVKDLGQVVYLPLYNQTKLFGFIILGRKKSGDAYSVEDINVLDIIRKQASVALENARLYSEVKDFNVVLQKEVNDATRDLKISNQELRIKNEILMALQKLTSLITKTLDPKILTQSIADGIYQELGYLGGLVIFVDQQKKWTYVDAITRSQRIMEALRLLPAGVSIKDLHGRFDLDERSLTLRAIESHEIKLGDKLSEMVSPTVPAPLCDKMQKIVNIKSMVAVPIYSENEVIGAIDFMLDKNKETITQPELEIMQLLANQTGIIYRNLYLYDQVQKFNSQLRNANLQLKRLDKAKSEFISIASHQLRTPLTIIKGYMSMFLDGSFGKIEKYQAEQMEKVYESNERLINLVEDLLNISRIESDRMEYHFEEHSLGELTKSVVDELKLKADKKGLNLTFRAEKKIPNIFFDIDKLRQVAMNIIDNALKYTNNGKVAVSVTKDAKNLIFAVKDTGIGIDPKDMRNLFQKFSRSKTVSVMNTEGTGLGLFVARKIVESHGGKIWAESKGEDKGSQFYISLRIGYKPEQVARKPIVEEEEEK